MHCMSFIFWSNFKTEWRMVKNSALTNKSTFLKQFLGSLGSVILQKNIKKKHLKMPKFLFYLWIFRAWWAVANFEFRSNHQSLTSFAISYKDYHSNDRPLFLLYTNSFQLIFENYYIILYTNTILSILEQRIYKYIAIFSNRFTNLSRVKYDVTIRLLSSKPFICSHNIAL